MGATIKNHPDMKTVGYAELWSADPFVIVANDWWPQTSLPSEDKGDQWGIQARYKIDVPARCWVFWEGTATESGHRVLQVQRAADGQDNPPGASFLPVESGVNVIAFGADPEPEPEPPVPEPEPEPQPEPPEIPGLPPGWTPNSIHIYGGGTKSVVSYYVEPEFVTLGIPHEQYLEFWHKCEQLLEDAISEFL